MRTPTTKSTVRMLTNGIQVKGSYKACIRGMYVDVIVMDTQGCIIGSRSVKYDLFPTNPSDELDRHLTAMVDVLTTYKLDTITSMNVLNQVIPQVITRAFASRTKAA